VLYFVLARRMFRTVFTATQLAFAILSGLAAGGLHVFSGPDHLAAIAPLSVGRRSGTWRIGARWGLGHAGGVLFVGVASLLVREIIPLDAVSSWGERLVGLMLVGIGLWGLRKAFSTRIHVHEHAHDGEKHVHMHLHAHPHLPGHHHEGETDTPHTHTHAAFAVGTLHGIAGSSHLLGILPALAFPTRIQALTYLCSYGLGTIGAMSFFSTAIAFLTSRSPLASVTAGRWMMASCSAFAVGLGAYWLGTSW